MNNSMELYLAYLHLTHAAHDFAVAHALRDQEGVRSTSVGFRCEKGFDNLKMAADALGFDLVKRTDKQEAA